MKIAFVLPTLFAGSTKRNGIKMQAILWGKALAERGHKVEFVSPWNDYDWQSFDVIHIFSSEDFGLINNLHRKGINNIVMSPIIDTIQSKRAYKFASYWGSQKLRLTSPNFLFRINSNKIQRYCVRSHYEAGFVENSYGVSSDRIDIIPLSYRLSCDNLDLNMKEPYCFHISTLSQERKNVRRLIQASIKYNFKLVLAGSPGSDTAFAPLKELIDNNSNISYLGIISDEELINQYKKAKVFALPSICEGVGMVALDAAMFGCEVVITKIGGPKEYYADLAHVVDPYSVDCIGQGIIKALQGHNQPALKEHMQNNFNFNICVNKLIQMYSKL